MAEGRTMDFCTECRRETGYALQKRIIEKTIRDKEYRFEITVAVCSECGAGMNIPGLIDKNIREIDEQYRIAEGLMAIGDIEKLMKLYKIGKAPLSLALGFGEVTISRYLSGQVPSREYSEITSCTCCIRMGSAAACKGKGGDIENRAAECVRMVFNIPGIKYSGPLRKSGECAEEYPHRTVP